MTVIAFRFLPFRLLYVLGVELPGEDPFRFAWEVASFQVSPELTMAGHVHTLAFILGLFVALSVVYYRRKDAFERRSPIHPVGLFGWLHAVLAIVLLAGAVLFARYHTGITVPVGGLFAIAFAYLLLSADLTSEDEPTRNSHG